MGGPNKGAFDDVLGMGTSILSLGTYDPLGDAAKRRRKDIEDQKKSADAATAYRLAAEARIKAQTEARDTAAGEQTDTLLGLKKKSYKNSGVGSTILTSQQAGLSGLSGNFGNFGGKTLTGM